MLKAAYSACAVAGRRDLHVGKKLVRCFMPMNDSPGRLVYRDRPGRSGGAMEIWRGESRLRVYVSSVMTDPEKARVTADDAWRDEKIECAYIPVKDMLANAPGFSSLYKERVIHFEEVYADILDRAYRPPLRGPRAAERRNLLQILEMGMKGVISTSGETFMWSQRGGASLEFPLVAEGYRKLGLLWLLVQNGTLWKGSVLFWDEPEANLNPALMRLVAETLTVLQRHGVQIFLATHSLAFIKELQLAQESKARKTSMVTIRYHSLYRDAKEQIHVESSDDYLDLSSNAIAEAMDDLFDRTMSGDK